MQIIPAILENKFSVIANRVRQVGALVEWIQIDICDGAFVPSKTYASSGRSASLDRLGTLVRQEGAKIELDMMVDFDCPRCMTNWSKGLAALRPDRIIFHLGSTYRWDELFSRLVQQTKEQILPFECGLGVRIDTPRAEIRKLLHSHAEFSYIQIMGIEQVGRSGQKMSSKLLPYILQIKRSFPDHPIQIDGGVKAENLAELEQVGVDRAGMNSGLFHHTDPLRLLRTIQSDNVSF